MNFRTFSFQNAPPPPSEGAKATATTKADGAKGPAPAQAPSALTTMGPLLMLPVLLAILWFSSRSQKKREEQEQEKRKALKKGDHVITRAGLVGKLVKKDDKYAQVEIAPGVKAKMLVGALVGLDTGDAPESAESK